ncbi:hypothetical protein AB0C74_00295 [Spirillospora sp. NPDC048832]
MEDSRMDTAPSAPEQPSAPVRPVAPGWPAGPGLAGERVLVDEAAMPEQPGPGAVPVLSLTPVVEPPAGREPWEGALRLALTGVAVMAVTAELGRRAGAPVRLTAICTAGAGAMAVGPWLVPQLVPRLASA